MQGSTFEYSSVLFNSGKNVICFFFFCGTIVFKFDFCGLHLHVVISGKIVYILRYSRAILTFKLGTILPEYVFRNNNLTFTLATTFESQLLFSRWHLLSKGLTSTDINPNLFISRYQISATLFHNRCKYSLHFRFFVLTLSGIAVTAVASFSCYQVAGWHERVKALYWKI